MSAPSGNRIDDVMRLSFKRSVFHRLPWLFIGLFGGIAASHIVQLFEDALSKNLILAAFIPLIVYMSDAVGTQMEAFIIRDTAIHPKLNLLKYFLKHLIITSLIAGILAGTLFIYSIIFNQDLQISLVLSLSLFISIISSVFSGLFLPTISRKFKLDPANTSGPIATIIQDILSVTIYLLIASSLLSS